MKHFLSVLLLSLLLFSCYEYNDTYVKVDIVKVEFVAKSVFSVETEGFRSTADELTIPSNFKAYFIAAESKGPYTSGQLIKTLDVSTGVQTIEVPKLKYNVYVTNYEQSGAWYTWTNAIEQLPQGSDVLYLYGSNNINYSIQVLGEVEVKTPYAAVMIKGDSHITEAPKHYDSNSSYTETADHWWLKYIRNSTTNTGVKLQFTGSGLQTLTINDAIQSNKVYKYILNTSVGNTSEDNNFNIIVEEFDETINREVDFW